MYLTIV